MKINKKIVIGIILIGIILGVAILYSQTSQLITINRTVTESTGIKSETTFILEEDTEVTFKYKYAIKEGNLNIVLKDKQNREQRLDEINKIDGITQKGKR